MRTITQEEARMKICPILCQGNKEKQHCITSYCMAWVELPQDKSDKKHKEHIGYCAYLSI